MSEARPKYKPSGPFVWLSKEALKRIRDGYDQHSGLDSGLSVYLALSETANREGSPSITLRHRHISALAGCSTRTVARALDLLKGIGVLTWIQATGSGDYPQGPNTYTLTGYPSATNAHPPATVADPSASPRNGTLAESTEEQEELLREPLKNNYPASPEVAEIYAAYPRKVAPAEAKKAIAKALKTGAAAETLLAQVKLYATAVSRWPEGDRQYVPYPASWFNKERWKEDPTEWERKSVSVNKQNGGGNGQSDGTNF